MPSRPVRVLDLYCGDSPRVPAALRNRFVGRPIEYVGIDLLGRRSFKRESAEGIVRYQYIDADIRPNDPAALSALLGQFPEGHFHEIHLHMPGTNEPSSSAHFRNRLSRLLSRGGRLYASIQSQGSPLFDFRLQNLPPGDSKAREAFQSNRMNLRRAAEQSGLRLEQYGSRAGTASRWFTREEDFVRPNDFKQEKILAALRAHSASAPGFAEHFVIFKRMG